INSTKKLSQDLSSQKDPMMFLAGQITGVEGYFESTCIGLMVSYMLDAKLQDKVFLPPPRETAMGSLLHALTGEEKDEFQPTNINFGLFPPLEKKVKKREKRDLVVARARQHFTQWKIETQLFNETPLFIEEMAEQLKNPPSL
ncbi:MAG: FAD-dependent oxidoreductase, partial [Bdellovibrionales bacterium]|nr:FAD-dependent oxidoreductase [Bdellovibrionales bacterium]